MHKVFGIGLNKTGTTTLGDALRLLGYRHMSCRRDLLIQVRNENYDELFQVCDNHDSFEDWPYPLVYQRLFNRYRDNARYILTLRKTPEIWLRSLKNHSLKTSPNEHCRLLAYGYAYPHGFEREHLDFYKRHNDSVIDYFNREGARDLLAVFCWENGDCFDDLCSFLGVPTPEVPLPYANKFNFKDIEQHPNYQENVERIQIQLKLLGVPHPESLISWE